MSKHRPSLLLKESQIAYSSTEDLFDNRVISSKHAVCCCVIIIIYHRDRTKEQLCEMLTLHLLMSRSIYFSRNVQKKINTMNSELCLLIDEINLPYDFVMLSDRDMYGASLGNVMVDL